MQCREFRENHVGYVDDCLSAAEMAEMRAHAQACAACSRHDVAVRRGLLIARNLPSVEPSPEFMTRLKARIASSKSDPLRRAQPPLASFGALAAAIGLVAYLALETTRVVNKPMRLAPVVAMAHESEPTIATSPAFVASAATGMTVWPAVLMLDQAPQHFADVQMQQAVLRR